MVRWQGSKADGSGLGGAAGDCSGVGGVLDCICVGGRLGVDG